MKNAEQFNADITADAALKAKFREGFSKLRTDETVKAVDAAQSVARELGYELSHEEAKKFLARLQAARERRKRMLSDDELMNVAGGDNTSCCVCYGCGPYCN